MMRPRVMPFLFYALFFFSGSAGLGYQMVWSRMIAIGLGQEMPAVLAVIAAFMGGMALGACALDGANAHAPSAMPPMNAAITASTAGISCPSPIAIILDQTIW